MDTLRCVLSIVYWSMPQSYCVPGIVHQVRCMGYCVLCAVCVFACGVFGIGYCAPGIVCRVLGFGVVFWGLETCPRDMQYNQQRNTPPIWGSGREDSGDFLTVIKPFK